MTEFRDTDQSTFPFPKELMSRVFWSNCFDINHESGDDAYYKEGTLRQVIECASASNGRILHAVDIPMPFVSPNSMFATDIAAWKRTIDMPYCKDVPLPTGDIRRASVATAHAYSCWHIEPNGWGVFLSCDVGSIVVFVHGDECDDQTSGHRDSSVRRYIDDTESKGKIESICLRAGDTMSVHR